MYALSKIPSRADVHPITCPCVRACMHALCDPGWEWGHDSVSSSFIPLHREDWETKNDACSAAAAAAAAGSAPDVSRSVPTPDTHSLEHALSFLSPYVMRGAALITCVLWFAPRGVGVALCCVTRAVPIGRAGRQTATDETGPDHAKNRGSGPARFEFAHLGVRVVSQTVYVGWGPGETMGSGGGDSSWCHIRS